MGRKKVVFVVLILIALLIFTGCESNISFSDQLSGNNIKKHLGVLIGLNGRKIGT